MNGRSGNPSTRRVLAAAGNIFPYIFLPPWIILTEAQLYTKGLAYAD